jgi:hypothetical protein
MEIVPFRSVGLLAFGDSRQIVREKVSSSFSTFEKVAGENETDSFDAIGVHVYYDDGGRTEFIEMFDPAEVSFRGISFLGRDLALVVSDMETLGFPSEPSDVGVKFEGVGIALTAPFGVVEGVAAYRKGYYD